MKENIAHGKVLTSANATEIKSTGKCVFKFNANGTIQSVKHSPYRRL
jgi:hypothetical protein